MVTGLVRAGLATAERETMTAGARPVEVVRLKIAAAGQKAIEE
jgi:capsid protein